MREWFNIKNSAGDDGPLEIDIYGPIGKYAFDDDAVSAQDVLDALRGARGRDVVMRINSEGGSVFDGFAIYSLLRDHQNKVTAYIDGLCASAASYIAAAADEVVMSGVAWVMIHRARGMAFGTAEDMRKQGEVMDGIDATIAAAYARRTDKTTADEFAALMTDETWMDAETAQSFGLVDRIAEAAPIAAAIDLRAPDALASAPKEARAAVLAMSAASDARENIEPNDGEGIEAGEARRSTIVDGRIFSK